MPTKFDPYSHRRRSIRLKGWDYSAAGTYFVTICAYRGQLIFGEIVGGKPTLTPIGHFVDLCWQAIPAHFPQVTLDMHIVMPNHFHGILSIRDDVGVTHESPEQQSHGINGPKKGSLGAIIGQFKSSVSRRFNQSCPPLEALGHPLWQRNFYDKIVRDEDQLHAYQTYIRRNPIKWEQDSLHPTSSDNKFNKAWR